MTPFCIVEPDLSDERFGGRMEYALGFKLLTLPATLISNLFLHLEYAKIREARLKVDKLKKKRKVARIFTNPLAIVQYE